MPPQGQSGRPHTIPLLQAPRTETERQPRRGGMATADDVGDEFMKLVDEYLEAFPLAASTTTSLSHNNVRFAAAKLLQRQAAQRSDRHQEWPGASSTRLAAIMMVLFVHECLVSSRRAILGMSREAFYALLSDIVRRDITRGRHARIEQPPRRRRRLASLPPCRRLATLPPPRHLAALPPPVPPPCRRRC